MIKEMTYISEHLSSLRQKITDLRNMNSRYSGKSEHGLLDHSALAMRTNRLLQIKKELASMLDRPNDPKVVGETKRTGSPWVEPQPGSLLFRFNMCGIGTFPFTN